MLQMSAKSGMYSVHRNPTNNYVSHHDRSDAYTPQAYCLYISVCK